MIIDLRGQRFGRLVVQRLAARAGNQDGTYWDCLCDCGAATVARAKDIRLGTTRSCGCARHTGRKSPPAELISGDRFGLLTVRREADRRDGFRQFICECDCGEETTVRGTLLRLGQTRSCGCLRKNGWKRKTPGSGLTTAELAA